MKLSKKQRAMLRRDVAPHVSWMTSLLDDLDETEARAKRLSNELDEASRMYTTAQAGREAAESRAERYLKLGEGDEGQKTSAGVDAPAVEATAHHAPGRDAEEPGSPSGDERWCPKHEVRRTALGCIYCMNEPDGEVPPHAYEDGGSGIGHCLLCGSDNESDGNHVAPTPPATSTPDEAERAAREWWAEHVNGVAADFDEHPEMTQALIALLRTRDAQARDAVWNEAVEACALHVFDSALRIAPEFRRIVQIIGDQLRALKRPDRAKGG